MLAPSKFGCGYVLQLESGSPQLKSAKYPEEPYLHVHEDPARQGYTWEERHQAHWEEVRRLEAKATARGRGAGGEEKGRRLSGVSLVDVRSTVVPLDRANFTAVSKPNFACKYALENVHP